MASSVADSETRSVNSFASSFSQRSFFGKLNKYELKRRFYEKLDDFKNKVLLHKEQGFIVYRARCVYSGGVVVLKGYSRESLTMQTRQRVFSEVTLLQRAQCPFILKCFDAFEDQGWWWLVLENCAAGDLYRIVQSTGPIREEGWLVSQVLLPILQTLAYLHAEGVIHRDIKPEHVLFNSEKVAKLSGFFLSWDVNRYSYPKDMVGTLDYVAPEVFVLNGPNAKQQQVTHYDYKVDIWGCGIMAYDVLVGSPPFNSDDPNATVEAILLREVEYPDYLSDDAVDFIDQCLTKDPTKRPTARQLLTHPWIRANLDWEPPEEFDDPIPNVDFSYYRVAQGGAGDELEGSEDEEREGKTWYNPATWFKRRNSLDDLLGGDGESRKGGRGGGGSGQEEGGRGGWRLTQSIGNMARTLMGNRTQVAPDMNDSAKALGPVPGGGLGGGGIKAYNGPGGPPGRVRSREDLEGVPEDDDEGLDPEGGPHHGHSASPGPGPGAGGPPRAFSPPPNGVPPLAVAPARPPNTVPSAEDEVVPLGSARSNDGQAPAAAAASRSLTAGAAGGTSGKGGGGDALKSPAFLPQPTTPPPGHGLEDGGGGVASPRGGSRPGSASMAPPAGARRVMSPNNAHDSATSSEVFRNTSSGSGTGGPTAGAAAAASAAAAAVAAVGAPGSRPASPAPQRLLGERSDLSASSSIKRAAGAASGDVTELLSLPPPGEASASASASASAPAPAGSSGSGAAACGGERPMPHLNDDVIKSAAEEGAADGQEPAGGSGAGQQPAQPPWQVPSGSGMRGATGSGSGDPAGGASPPQLAPEGSMAAALGVDPSHPVLPAGSSKTTPREREEAHKLAEGAA